MTLLKHVAETRRERGTCASDGIGRDREMKTIGDLADFTAAWSAAIQIWQFGQAHRQ